MTLVPSRSASEVSDRRTAFALRLAGALHRYGTPTHQLESTMKRVLARLGLDGVFFSIPTGIFAGFDRPEDHRTSVIRAESIELNLEKLTRLDELAERTIGGEIDVADASVEVEHIIAAPNRYSAIVSIAAYCVATGTAARIFGGGWREMAAATLVGLAVGLADVLLARSDATRRVFEIVAGVIASALATVAASQLAPFSIYLTTLAGLIILLPGLTVTTAMTELATGNLVSGTARLTGAILVFLQIAFGVALGGQVVRLFPTLSQTGPPLPLPDWTLWVSLLLTPPALTVLMRAMPRDGIWITLASIAGFTGARAGASLLGPELGAFLGAVALGSLSNIFGRTLRRPAAVPLLPGLLLLVPGSIGFGSLERFVARDVTAGVEAAFSVALVAVALAMGLLTANVVVPPRRTL